MRKNLAALIPAYNCEKTIGEIVKKTKYYIDKVLVVSDGSKDLTSFNALSAGADVLNLKENSGKGFAIQEGLAVLLSLKLDGILFIDGDGQHNPEEIPKFIKAFEKFDFVIGVRKLKQNNYPPLRRIPNYLGGLFLKGMTGIDLEDYQCGFRLASCNFLRKLPKIFKRYEIESQMLIIASELKVSTGIVEIETLYGNHKSYFKAVKDTFLICLESLDLYYERKKTKNSLDTIFIFK